MRLKTQAAVVSLAFIGFTAISDTAKGQIGIKVNAPKVNIGKNKSDKKEERSSENSAGKSVGSDKAKEDSKSNILSRYNDAQIQKILDKSSYPEYDNDYRKLEKIKKLYIFQQNGNTFYGTMDYDFNKAKSQVSEFTSSRKQLSESSSRYTEFWDVYKARMNENESMHKLYLEDKKAIDEFERVLATYGDPLTEINKKLEEALSTANELKAKGSLKDTWNNNQYDLKVIPALDRADFLILVRQATKENDAENITLAKKAAESRGKCEEIKAGIRQAELEAVKCPVEKYKGTDKEALKKRVRAEWTKSYPNDKILGIYIVDEQWDRQKGSNWNQNYNRYEQYDNSWLMVRVIIQNTAQLATIYEASIGKNHLNGNTLDLSYFNKSLGISKGEILVKNVK